MIVYYNESVVYKSHGVGQCRERGHMGVKSKNPRKGESVKNNKMVFFFQSLYLRDIWRVIRSGSSKFLLR